MPSHVTACCDEHAYLSGKYKWFMLINHLYMLPWDYTLNAHYKDWMGYFGARLFLYLLNAHAHSEFWFFVNKGNSQSTSTLPTSFVLYCMYLFCSGAFNAPSLDFFQVVYSWVFFFICQICHILFTSRHDMSYDTILFSGENFVICHFVIIRCMYLRFTCM